MGKLFSRSRQIQPEITTVLPSEQSPPPLYTLPTIDTPAVTDTVPAQAAQQLEIELNPRSSNTSSHPISPPSTTATSRGELEQNLVRGSANSITITPDATGVTGPIPLRFELSSASCRELSEKYYFTENEIKLLWRKFNQFELNSDNTVTLDSALHSFYNPFAKNIFKRISLTNDNLITFESYIQYLSKWKNATNALKIQLIFEILGNGNSLQPSLIKVLLSLSRPQMTDIDKNELAQIIVDTMDTKDSNCIDSFDFMNYFNQDFMLEHIRQHLQFTINEAT